MDIACTARHEIGSRAAVDNSSWDGGAAMSGCADANSPSACYGAICAGKKAGDADKQSSWALPHHKAPGDPPNAAGVRNALSRLPQTQGLTNRSAAEAHLNAHMKAISPESASSGLRQGYPEGSPEEEVEETPEQEAAEHSHLAPNAATVAHTHDDAAAGHAHAADSQYGELGPMLDAGQETNPLLNELEPGESGGTSSSLGYAWSGMNAARPPRDNLLRRRPGGLGLRTVADGSALGELFGIFSEFNSWYPVFGEWEGPFMERVLPGAFKETIANDRSGMRVLFDHGFDPQIGSKPLGPIRTLEERAEGPYFDVPLYNTSYNRDDIFPLLEGELMNGQKVGSGLGASFRFSVLEDQWNRHPKPTKRNPDAWPERSIVRAQVYEFGPVPFPANAGATASGRSLTLEWQARLAGDPRFQAEFVERVGSKVAERIMAAIPDDLRQAMQPEREAIAQRQARLRRRARVLLLTT